MSAETGSRLHQTAEGALELLLCGTLDLFVATELRQNALACYERALPVSVNCEHLDRLDASALQVLLCLQRQMAARGTAHFSMSHVAPGVAQYLRNAGAHALLGSAGASPPRPAPTHVAEH